MSDNQQNNKNNKNKKDKKSTRKRPIYSQYLDIEAQETSSEASTYTASDTDMQEYATNEHTSTWQQFTSKLEQKYSALADNDDEIDLAAPDAYTDVPAMRSQISLMPTVQSPKLWLIRVRPGKERQVLLKMMSECKENVYSVVVKDGLPGYVYVESHSKQHVQAAVDSCKFVAKRRITVVPMDEMVEAMTYRKNEVALNSYVRMKKGRYRDEIGMVVEKVSDEMVRVHLVPVIDGTRRLFVPDEHENVIRMQNGYMHNKDFYTDRGFLEKTVRIADVRLGETPTVNEMKYFQGTEYRVGEKVTVKRGELQTLSGRVKARSDTHLLVETGKRTFTVSEHDVQKSVSLGDEVQVKNEGNGTVVHVQGETAVVAIDNFSREVVVRIDELQPPREPYRIRVNTQRPRRKRDPLLFKRVTITKGLYKGYDGTVKDCYRDTLSVQLVSNLNRVDVHRDSVMLTAKTGDAGMSYDGMPYTSGARTPVSYRDASKTPVSYRDASKTPVSYRDASKTPARAAHTPVSYRDAYKTPVSYRDASKTPVSYRDASKTPVSYRDNHTPSSYKDNATPSSYRDSLPYDSTPTNTYRGTQLLINDRQVEVLDITDGIVVTHTHTVPLSTCQFIKPSKYDRVIVLRGSGKGRTGILVRMDDSTAMIRCTDGGAITVGIDDISRMA